jgi:sortase (surface protein transpeptidase)
LLPTASIDHLRARRRPLAAALAMVLLALFVLPALARADTPPNPNDPCASSAGQDKCNTTGVGRYDTYKFGTRWFGDYRGAIAGVSGPAFCIDLGYWYPSRSYGYRRRAFSTLTNKRGGTVSAANLHRMAYALWQYGRSNTPNQQSAMMMYIHGLMGDAQPGEVPPNLLGPAVNTIYNQISSAANRYAGPYTITAALPAKVVAGTPTTLTLRVRSSTGAAVPGVSFGLSVKGATSAPATATSSSSGTATVTLTPNSPSSGLSVSATAASLPSTLPVMYVPTNGGAVSSGQRLVTPASQSLTAHATTTVVVSPQVHTQVSDGVLAAGGTLSDSVAVSGLDGQAATVTATLYGPYPTATAVNCQGTPVWSGTVPVQGDGTYNTAPVTLPTAGYYTYLESIAATSTVEATATTCADTSETTIVQGSPAVATQISSATTAPGSQISDQAVVSGLGALSATVNVELWGPYASASAISCTGTPASTTSFTANGDGTYTTTPVTVPAAGYYTFQESIAATAGYGAVQTSCNTAGETTFAHGTPVLKTQASSAVVRPGSVLSDRIGVSGLGTTPATIKVDLFGPYASVSDINCAGRPLSEKSVTVTGNGTFHSPGTTVPRAGFYVFRERIAATPLIAAVLTPCSVTAETTLGAPMIITGPGERIYHGPPAKASIAAADVPNQIQIPSLGVSAPVFPEAIDLKLGQVDVPSNIHQTGWWKDGAAPGDSSGTTLIFGHVDSAAAGAGAFYPLKSAQPGTIVSVTTGGGHVYRYRVTRVQSVPKADLPTSIYTRSGPRRLVLVTCGGPFDYTTRHYVDNVIVYASPA